MNCFSHLFTLQFTHPFVIVCFQVFNCEIHGTVPLLQINVTFLSFTEMRMGMGTVVFRDGCSVILNKTQL